MIAVTEFKERVKQIVGPKAFRKSALNIRDGAGVFDQVLANGRYRTVLEIGTYRGLSTAYIAQFCERVITIDLAHGWLEANGATFDRKAFWQQLGVADKIDLRIVQDAAEKKKLIDSLEFDLAFIDGGKKDIAQDFASVKRCGTVLFHDYGSRGRGYRDYVYDFINALPKQHVKIMDIFALWTETHHDS